MIDAPAQRRAPVTEAKAGAANNRSHRRFGMDKCPEGIPRQTVEGVLRYHSQSHEPPLPGKAECQRSSRTGSSSLEKSDVIGIAAYHTIQCDDIGGERRHKLNEVALHCPELRR